MQDSFERIMVGSSRKASSRVGRKTAPRAASAERDSQDTHALRGLSVLHALAAGVGRTTDFADIVNLALTQMIELTGMRAGAVMLVDEERRALHAVADYHLSPALKASLYQWPVPLGRYIPGIAAERCELLVVDDAKNDERETPALRKEGIETHICIPLAFRGRALGVLGLLDDRPRSFSQVDLDLFTAVGEQLAVAIERTRLLDRQTDLTERLQSLNEITRIALSGAEIAEMFEQVGDEVRKLIDHDRLSIMIRVPGEDKVRVFAASGPGDMPSLAPMPFSDLPAGEVIRTGHPFLRSDLVREAVYPFESILRTLGHRSLLVVPLRAHDRIMGSLCFASYQSAHYGPRELEVSQDIADHLAIVVEHALAVEGLKETARLQERTRLAREIHDTLAQSLTGLVIQLEMSADLIDRDPIAARDALRRMQGVARETLEEARRSVWDLRPAGLAPGMLTEAISREMVRTHEQGLQTSLSTEGEQPASMDTRSEVVLLRIAQEALTNVRRHAHAHNVAVKLTYGASGARLEVADDGIGFDPTSTRGLLSPAGGGFGLTGMQERARLAGGRMEIQTAPTMGTRVSVEIPYQPPPEPLPSFTGPAAPGARLEKSRRISVLVVDDHEVVRHGIRHILARCDDLLVVGEAGDGEDAIRQIQARRPDVVLLDLQMPVLDGLGTLRRLRAEGLETTVILLSVHAKDEQIFEALRAGARGYLLKDVGREDLVRAVRTVSEGGSLLQPVVAGRLIQRLDVRASSTLTARELDVLKLLATGARNKEIAAHFFMSLNTVKFHVAHIYQKLGVQTRTEAVHAAAQRGLVNV